MTEAYYFVLKQRQLAFKRMQMMWHWRRIICDTRVRRTEHYTRGQQEATWWKKGCCVIVTPTQQNLFVSLNYVQKIKDYYVGRKNIQSDFIWFCSVVRV